MAELIQDNGLGRCPNQRLADWQETANFCYFVNRFVLRYYRIRVAPQNPGTFDYQKIFNEKYFNGVFYFTMRFSSTILTKMQIQMDGSTITEKTFDENVENLLRYDEPIPRCICLLTLLCIYVAILGVYFTKLRGIPEAKYWAYKHMLRIGVAFLIGN